MLSQNILPRRAPSSSTQQQCSVLQRVSSTCPIDGIVVCDAAQETNVSYYFWKSLKEKIKWVKIIQIRVCLVYIFSWCYYQIPSSTRFIFSQQGFWLSSSTMQELSSVPKEYLEVQPLLSLLRWHNRYSQQHIHFLISGRLHKWSMESCDNFWRDHICWYRFSILLTIWICRNW